MPAYNEGIHIKDNLLKASKIISGFVHNYRIIAVDDGSSDNTLSEIISASESDSKISYISYNPNRGKGKAITSGISYANSDYIAFLDSDLELNPMMLKSFLKAMKEKKADMSIILNVLNFIFLILGTFVCMEMKRIVKPKQIQTTKQWNDTIQI